MPWSLFYDDTILNEGMYWDPEAEAEVGVDCRRNMVAMIKTVLVVVVVEVRIELQPED